MIHQSCISSQAVLKYIHTVCFFPYMIRDTKRTMKIIDVGAVKHESITRDIQLDHKVVIGPVIFHRDGESDCGHFAYNACIPSSVDFHIH